MAATYSAGDNNASWYGGTIINGRSSQNNYGFYLGVRETYVGSSAENTSNIDIQIGIKNNGTRFSTGGWCFKYTVDGVVYDYPTGVSIGTNYAGYYDDVRPITIDGSNNRGMYVNGIPHNDDGNKTVHIKVEMYNSNYGSYTPGYCVAEGDFLLSSIPRASTPTVSDGNIGYSTTIKTNRKSTAFTHTLLYAFGSLSGTIATGVGDSHPWTIPTSFYTQIPNSPSGTGTITCITYNGSTEIGRKTCSFKAIALKSDNLPDVSLDVVDTNRTLPTGNTIQDLTGDTTNKKLIRYMSNAIATLTASAKNSSTIKQTTITNNGSTTQQSQSGATVSQIKNYSNIQTIDFIGTATDTRDYPNDFTVNDLTLVPYIQLTLDSLELYKSGQTSNDMYMKGNGKYYHSSSFGRTNNSLLFQYRYKENGSSDDYSNWATASMTINNDDTYSFDFLIGTGFNYQKAYDFQIKVSDKLMIVEKSDTSKPGIPIIGINENFIEAWGELFIYRD